MQQQTTKRLPWHWTHLVLLVSLPIYASMRSFWPEQLLLPGWLVLNLALLGIAEYLQRFRADWTPTARDLHRDGIIASINIACNAVAGMALTMLAATWAERHAWDQQVTWLSGQPFAVSLIIGLAFSELASYFLHRSSHHDNLLWRVHMLHHRPTRLNLANSLTAHPFNALLDQLARVAPLLLIGIDAFSIQLIAMFQLTQSLVAHANIKGRIGVLNYFISSVEQHRLHHSTDEQHAGNYGTALPLWDQLFGTWRFGNSPAEVGVYHPTRYPSEHALSAHLRWPWRHHKAPAVPNEHG
jgi:sterol desaturase/sphingolipid hydroxylase (fatty acid hydroxylase superfamily)